MQIKETRIVDLLFGKFVEVSTVLDGKEHRAIGRTEEEAIKNLKFILKFRK